jgi:hypothetical protein
MRRISFVQLAGVLVALFAASFVSFPSFPKGAVVEAAFSNSISVNRALKGDRLPPVALRVAPPELGSPLPERSQIREKVPVGCDSAFSPVASPRLANIFKRCTV